MYGIGVVKFIGYYNVVIWRKCESYGDIEDVVLVVNVVIYI